MEMINRRVPNIIIPLDKKSEELLFRNEDSMSGLYYTLPICREDLDLLQKEDFFEKINTKFNLNIDEYEEEYIEISKQKKILTYLENEYTSDDYICDFYRKKIILFINISLKLNKPIFIFL